MTDRILYICSYLIPSVREHFNRLWYSKAGLNEKQGTVSALQNAGLDVVILSPVIPDSHILEFRSSVQLHDAEKDVNVLVPPTANVYGILPINYILTVIFTIIYAIIIAARNRPDFTLSYNFRPENALPGLITKCVLGARFILQYEDGLLAHPSWLRRYSADATRFLCDRGLDGAVCTNESLADLLETQNTAIVRGFPSIGLPDSLPKPKYAETDSTVVMFAGHFDRLRGVDLFLDFIPYVENEDVLFWISGTGKPDQKERVRNRIEDLGDDRVTYFGTLPWDDYRTRVVSADILVNFQDPDAPISEFTFPSKILDFMSAGKVIISTDMGDLSEELADELVIDGSDPKSLADTLRRTIRIQSSGDCRVGGLARKWVSKHCTHDFAGRKYKLVFEAAKEK